MTNLFDFLREILHRAAADQNDIKTITISNEEVQWIHEYFREPDFFMNMKATALPEQGGNEILYSQHFEMKGKRDELYNLMTEAMLNNPLFAEVVCSAREFWFEHARTCPDCEIAFLYGTEPESWKFTPHK